MVPAGESMADPLRAIALIGYRGTGKSTVGRLLARQLGLDFADADAEIERRLGISIAELFATGREPFFRDEEERTLAALTARDRLVIATGGGAVLRESSRVALRRFGTVIWLKAAPEILADRLRGDHAQRPALTSAGTLPEIERVLAHREPIYRSAAHLVIETGGATPAEVVGRILQALSPPDPA